MTENKLELLLQQVIKDIDYYLKPENKNELLECLKEIQTDVYNDHIILKDIQIRINHKYLSINEKVEYAKEKNEK